MRIVIRTATKGNLGRNRHYQLPFLQIAAEHVYPSMILLRLGSRFYNLRPAPEALSEHLSFDMVAL